MAVFCYPETKIYAIIMLIYQLNQLIISLPRRSSEATKSGGGRQSASTKMSKTKSITQNTAYYTIALVCQKILSFIYFAYLARVLGAENIGKYVFALSFTVIFSIFVDVGLTQVLTREVAKTRATAQKYLGIILSVKIPLAVLTFVSLMVVINLLGYDNLGKSLVYLAGLVMILDSFFVTFWSIFRGFQNLKYESIGIVIYQIIVVGLGFTAIYLNLDLVFFVLILVFASIFNFLFSMSLLIFKLNILPKLIFDKTVTSSLLKMAFPFALLGLFSHLYAYMDTVLLSKLAGDKYVGWYSVPFKITFALQIIPKAFSASIYPAFSKLFGEGNKIQLAKLFEKACFYLMFLAIPFSAGIFAVADKIILSVWPEFAASIVPLQIIISALLFIFLSFPVGALLNACNKQAINTTNMGIVAVLSIALNFILIPRYNIMAASSMVLVTNTLFFFLGLVWVGKIIKYNKGYLLKSFFKILVVSLVVASIIFYLKSFLNLFILFLLGAVLYFGLMFLVGGIKVRDLKEVRKSLISRE